MQPISREIGQLCLISFEARAKRAAGRRATEATLAPATIAIEHRPDRRHRRETRSAQRGVAFNMCMTHDDRRSSTRARPSTLGVSVEICR